MLSIQFEKNIYTYIKIMTWYFVLWNVKRKEFTLVFLVQTISPVPRHSSLYTFCVLIHIFDVVLCVLWYTSLNTSLHRKYLTSPKAPQVVRIPSICPTGWSNSPRVKFLYLVDFRCRKTLEGLFRPFCLHFSFKFKFWKYFQILSVLCGSFGVLSQVWSVQII